MGKKQRGFVIYTKSGKIIPGSLIVTTSGGYPVDGLYVEVTPDLCCGDILLPRSVARTSTLSCFSPQSVITVYMTNECFNNPTVGCKVYEDAAGTVPLELGYIQLGTSRYQITQDGSIFDLGQPCDPTNTVYKISLLEGTDLVCNSGSFIEVYIRQGCLLYFEQGCEIYSEPTGTIPFSPTPGSYYQLGSLKYTIDVNGIVADNGVACTP
jgi:hypothetical protein